MESLSLEEEKIIRYIRNLFRLRKKLNYTAIKDIRNIFRLEKETNAIKEYLNIVRIFLSIKNNKKKIIIN